MRVLAVSLALLLLLSPVATQAQRPDTVFFENLTFDEIRDLIKGGARSVIVAVGGTEDAGPHMVLGAHNQVVTYAADKIARALGNTLVAPVLQYGPNGSPDAQKPGAISLQDDQGFQELLTAAANSMKGSGFKNIILLGDSEGSQSSLKAFAEKTNTAWKGTGVRILYVPDYYAKSRTDQEKYVVDKAGIAKDKIGTHANIVSTSEMMFIHSASVRVEKLEPGNATNGVNGDPTKATPQLGQMLLKIKIDDAVAQIKQLMAQAAN